MSGLLLLHSTTGNAEGMTRLSSAAEEDTNVKFVSLFLTSKLDECLDLLIASDRISEAALFARTYLPSRMGSVQQLWAEQLRSVNEKAAQALADPVQYPNLFGSEEELET